MIPVARHFALSLMLACGVASAASFPSKPLHIVVPYPPGSGPLDAVVRLVADEMSTALKQPVLVEYKPGASTTIGANTVVRAPADGHTMFVNAASFLITAQLMSNLPYDPHKDFVPITMLHSYPHVLIAPPDAEYKTTQAFLETARKKGEDMSYGSFGNASSGHLAFERLKQTYEFPMLHVPYKGGDGLKDIVAGRIEAMLFDLPGVLPFAESGKLTPLAVAANERHPLAPDVPTFEEATGVPFASQSWFGILVRSDTPPELQQRLNEEIVAVLRKPAVIEQMRALGIDLHPSTPQEFADFMARESEGITEAIRFSGARME